MRDGLPSSSDGNDKNNAPRARWMGVLAKADLTVLQQAWSKMQDKPAYRLLRGPETGLALVRGRIGGVGERFNVGEISLTRCSLALSYGTDGEVAGHGYVAGCNADHALYAALFDALLQLPKYAAVLEETLIAPLLQEQATKRRSCVETAQASRVEFFTMVRGG